MTSVPPNGFGLPPWHPAVVLASGFGVGFLPVSPGSWGSLAALPAAWLLRRDFGILALAGAALLVFAVGWWAAATLVKAGAGKDPQPIVIDEIAGQWLTLLAAPPALPAYALGFALFRLFDIWKPWPVRWADRALPGGLGIMLDDVLAAVYAGAMLLIIGGVLGVRP